MREGGVIPLTSVIFGYPQETPESIRKTFAVCEQCDIYPSVGFLLPLPYPYLSVAAENERIKEEQEYLIRIGDRQNFHINLTKMPDDEFISIASEELMGLAKRQGLELQSPFKTTTYQSPPLFRKQKVATHAPEMLYNTHH